MKQAEALHNTENQSGQKDNHRPKDEIHHLLETAEEYFKTRKDLMKLKLVSKSSDIISSLVSSLVVIFIMLFFFLILNIGLGLLLGELFDKTYYGFFVLAGFYLVIGIIMISAGKNMIKRSVANNLIKKFIK